MNWEVIAAVAELIGAVGLIAVLIYLVGLVEPTNDSVTRCYNCG